MKAVILIGWENKVQPGNSGVRTFPLVRKTILSYKFGINLIKDSPAKFYTLQHQQYYSSVININ